MTIRWPCDVLRPQNVAFDIASRSLAGPTSVSGLTQVVASDAGIWKATYGSVIVNRRNHVLAWRAIATLMEGRLGSILVPLCRAYQPVAEDGVLDSVPHDDDAFFDDDSGYVGESILVTLGGSLAARAVAANIVIEYGGDIEPGMHFSIGERLYRVRTIVYSSDTAAAITFRPPLREAATSGAILDFDDPICRMRLATDQEMNLELALRRFGTPTVNFIEAV